jgi:predicted MFS family arabinose efflux permease
VLSDLGGRVSGIAFPLLVLGATGSPAKAGIVGAAGSLPLLVLTLPAGAYVDRWNRRTVMLASDAARCVALGSLGAAIALDRLAFAHVVAVAVVEGAGFVFFGVAERASLRRLVSDDDMPAALIRNQAREYGALLAGQPLGGLLFALGRVVPFAFDAVSYLVSVATVACIRTSFARERPAARTRIRDDLRDGLRWFWAQPFLRATSLVVTGMDFTVNALYLVAIVVARQRGASPALIGAMFVFLGLGGIAGSAAAPWLSRRLPTRAIVVGSPLLLAALVPLVPLLPGRVTPGVVYGTMFLLFPTWNATVGAYRVRVTPDELQARVASVATLLSLGLVPVAALVTGYLLEAAGQIATTAFLTGVAACAVAVAATSSAVRDAPATTASR